jgi:hypothetical protein
MNEQNPELASIREAVTLYTDPGFVRLFGRT